MPVTQFNDALLLPNGDLAVSGPFDPEQAQILGSVVICFMLFQEPETTGDPMIILKDVTYWNESDGANWEKTIKAQYVPHGLRAGPVRGVGAAIIVRHTTEPVPAIEVITWCVSKQIGQVPASGS